MKVFSGTANRPLADKMVKSLGIPLGEAEINRFSDGEILVKYNENIRGADLFIVQPTCPPGDNLIELLLLVDAARRASAKRITTVIPYFGYARQDRKDQPRVSLSAKLVANLISTAGADRVLTMDLHSPSIQGFFDIPFDHLYGSVIFVDHIRSLGLDDLVVVAPDVGSTKRARAYAKRLNAGLALVDKKRNQANEVGEMTLIGDVRGKNAVLVDDMVDTAGTLVLAAQELADNGAKRIYASCTHPILSGPAVERIEASPITRLFISDTLIIPEKKRNEKLEVLSSAWLFSQAISRIHNEESISSLFD